ncbi:MAG: DUF1579 family protein [Phycisphaerales bacterium]|nr:DUF1579 family protein [Phycisphaerales bacterium]
MRNRYGLILIPVALFLGGCGAPDLDEMMRKPERPVEYAQLDRFVGNWESFGEMKFAGVEESAMMAAQSTTRATANGWALVEEFEGQMNDKPVKGISLWWYDKAANRYHMLAIDDYGFHMTMKCRYNEKDNTWACTSEMRDTNTGQTLNGRGTMRWTDENTAEWESRGYAFLGLMKVMEMKGTMRKR